MKKLLLSFITLLAVGVTSFQAHAQDAIQLDGAAIEFTKETHDYGTIAYGSDGHCTFEFKNTGTAPLIISKANKSCGCTVPSWPQEPILPGETAVIKVKYDTKRPGAINKSVTIVSNAVNAPSAIIRIKGNVLPKPTAAAPVVSSGPTN
ncbi:MAG: hypothetical protein ACI865_001595 [Flavobacteriaceae bacterium]|jgi:hypothetical protein